MQLLPFPVSVIVSIPIPILPGHIVVSPGMIDLLGRNDIIRFVFSLDLSETTFDLYHELGMKLVKAMECDSIWLLRYLTKEGPLYALLLGSEI